MKTKQTTLVFLISFLPVLANAGNVTEPQSDGSEPPSNIVNPNSCAPEVALANAQPSKYSIQLEVGVPSSETFLASCPISEK